MKLTFCQKVLLLEMMLSSNAQFQALYLILCLLKIGLIQKRINLVPLWDLVTFFVKRSFNKTNSFKDLS